MDLPNKSVGPTPPPPDKKIEAVVTGAKKVNRPATKRFMDFLFAESPKQLGSKVGRDVIVPRLKAGLEEALNSFVAGMLWGESVNRPLGNTVGRTVLRGGGMSYNNISSMQNSMSQAREAGSTRSTGNYQDLVLPSMELAETLLANMLDLLNQYRVIAVGDLYELAGITSTVSDNAYGWTSLEGARISKVRDGYLLELPRPHLI